MLRVREALAQSKDPVQDGGAGGLARDSPPHHPNLYWLELPDTPPITNRCKGSFDFVASSHSRSRHCAQDDSQKALKRSLRQQTVRISRSPLYGHHQFLRRWNLDPVATSAAEDRSCDRVQLWGLVLLHVLLHRATHASGH